MSLHQNNNNQSGQSVHLLNQNISNANFNSHINDPNFFSFATHNFRSCSSSVKMNQIEQFFVNFNLDILGLSEMHLTTTQAKYYSCNLRNKPYHFLFSSTNPKYNCQGVGFLIRNYLYDHIFHHSFLYDRIAYIDLQFKNKTKLRVFQVYLPANTCKIDQFNLRTQIEKMLLELILDAQNKSYHIILMGDFNIDLYQKHHSHRKNKFHRTFIEKIFNLNFIHAATLIQKDNDPPPHTFVHLSSKKLSHLDYIFMS